MSRGTWSGVAGVILVAGVAADLVVTSCAPSTANTKIVGEDALDDLAPAEPPPAPVPPPAAVDAGGGEPGDGGDEAPDA
ncbi:MAG TPA: hypothetical protein VHE30_11055 [Polyangiaceae bacterium]|nr:hypothetical protein [Polyangiaceae bacterium]